MLEIQMYIPNNIKFNYIRGHQDKKKRKEQLTMAEKLNIMADKNHRQKCKQPQIDPHPKHQPNIIRKEIRSHYGTQDAARFIKGKYRWTQQALDNIKWELHAVFIQKQKYSRKKTTIKYIHRWLPSGLKRFGQNLGCPHCEGDGIQHDHDHFLTCEFSIRKNQRYHR